MITADTALCGHPTCDPYRRRNSVLDEQGDVVIYHACNGVRWIFRDDVCHGLVLGAGWTLTREAETDPVVTIHNIGDRSWVAHWQPSGRVFARHDTGYGLVAKAARTLLQAAACCKDVAA